MWFKNRWRNVFKNVLCDVTQMLKLRQSSRETDRCKDHLSWRFQTPRNEDSVNLSLCQPTKTILLTFEAQELHIANWQAQKHTPLVQRSSGTPSLVRSLTLVGLDSCIVLQLPTFIGRYLLQYVMSFSWSNLIGMPPTWRLEQKWNRPFTRLFSLSAGEK